MVVSSCKRASLNKKKHSCQKIVLLAIMEVTIDKFGRILIPQKVRKLLGFTPGKTLHFATDLETKTIELSLGQEEGEVSVKMDEFGFPVVDNGPSYPVDLDTVALIKEDREEYLNKKLGLK